jgi:hypothetical protein
MKMSHTKMSYPEKTDDIQFYALRGFEEYISYAIVAYDASVLVILRSETSKLGYFVHGDEGIQNLKGIGQNSLSPPPPVFHYDWIEASFGNVDLEAYLAKVEEISWEISKIAYRIHTFGFSAKSISEDEMNSIMLKYAHPQLFFI